jgi:hypothetical protein
MPQATGLVAQAVAVPVVRNGSSALSTARRRLRHLDPRLEVDRGSLYGDGVPLICGASPGPSARGMLGTRSLMEYLLVVVR